MGKDTFIGYACKSKGAPLEKMELELPTWDEDMVEMDVICCGICGTDIHTFDEGWGPTEFPCVAGHEVIGKVTRVGDNVKHIKVGDRCGVGCQSASCHKCQYCQEGNENLCTTHCVWTFNDHYDNPTKSKTYGGFAKTWRGNQYFAIPIPDAFTSEEAASFMCGGITTYAPLKRFNVGPGHTVGILGLGGLGHFAAQWAKAMGAKVVAFDVLPEKVDDAKKLGCDEYILINKEEQVEPYYNQITHLLATKIINKLWPQYFQLLANNGVFIQCDIPEEPLANIPPLVMAAKQIIIAGTFIGAPGQIKECLEFAAKHNIRTWVDTFPMDQINEAIDYVRKGKPHFRAVVKN